MLSAPHDLSLTDAEIFRLAEGLTERTARAEVFTGVAPLGAEAVAAQAAPEGAN